MYSITGDDVMIYSDVSSTESRKASSPKLTLKDNTAGTLEVTLPPGNAGYERLKLLTSELIVFRDKQEIWHGRIISEKMNFWNNRILTCEGELSYLNDTIQPQHKYAEGTTVGAFLESVISNHNKRYGDNEERYKFYIDEAYVYNYNETMPETVTDCEHTFDTINTNIVSAFECHIRIKRIDGKKYISLIKEEYQLNENSQVIRFGDNLLDFTKNWDLTDLSTVITPRGAVLEKEPTEDSDVFDTYVTLSDIPKDDVVEKEEIGEYERDENGKLKHDEDGNLIYNYPDKKDQNGNLVYKYKKDEHGYITIESETIGDSSTVVPTIRVDTNSIESDKVIVEFLDNTIENNGTVKSTVTSKIETDGMYAIVYLKNEDGEFYCLKDIYGHIEEVVNFNDAKDSVELLKQTRDYIKEHQFDQMTLEVSAVDMRYLSNSNEPLNILDRIRCISYPHGMNTLFTITELSIELDKPDSAKYTLEKTLYNTSSTPSMSDSISSVTSEIESPHSTILKKAQSNADKMLRENTNGYVSMVTKSENGRHSEALVISSGKDYTRSEHFWIWNANGLGHYTEYADEEAPSVDDDDSTCDFWNNNKKYSLNLGITMDGAIVANRITVGHMSADRVRTGVLMSQDGNVVWNLNADDTYNEETGKIYPAGSMMIKKGSINLGSGNFSVDDGGFLHAEKGEIGGFVITADSIYNDSITFNKSGLTFKNKNVDVGHMGSLPWADAPDLKLLSTSLEHDAAAIVWGIRENYSDEKYTSIFVYANRDYNQYEAGNFYMHRNLVVFGNLDLFGNQLINFELDPYDPKTIILDAVEKDSFLVLSNDSLNEDGTVNRSKLKSINVKKGFIIDS